jgi:hypothetical protein
MRARGLVWIAPLLVGAAMLLPSTPACAAESTVTPEPILIVKSFATTPATLTVGQPFKLDLTLDNVAGVAAKNLVVSVGSVSITATSSLTTTSVSTGIDVVVLGSNTKFVGDMAAGAVGQAVAFDLTSSPRSSSGPCSVPILLTYDTDAGRKSAAQTVGFVLTRSLVFDVAALEYPKWAIAGQQFDVAASVNNTNDFPVSGVAIAFRSDDATLSSAETTVGILEPGGSSALRAKVSSRKLGPLSVTLVISYKDDFGVPKQIRRPFAVRIDAPKETSPSVTTSPSRTLRARVLAFLRAFVGLGG